MRKISRGSLKALNQLLFPVRCVGCATLGNDICTACLMDWNCQNLHTTIRFGGVEPLPVFSFTYYTPVARRIILSAKESHIKSSDDLLIDAITETVKRFLENEWIDALIPIPSRRANVRKRGREFIADIVSASAENLGLSTYPILIHSRKVRDQSGLDLTERWNNLDGAFVLSTREKLPASARVLLVDDLVTTGATLIEAARALNYAGIEVIGGVTACVAKPLR